VDATNHVLTLNQATNYAIPSGSRYFVQGDLSMLDAPGEFYFGGGYVYYSPRSLPIASQQITAPQVKAIVQICPRPAAGTSTPCLDQNIAPGSVSVHDVSLEGLTLEASEFTSEWPDRLAASSHDPTAMVYLRSTQNVTIKNCHLKNAGQDAVAMVLANQNNAVYGNLIEQSGLSAIDIRATGTSTDGMSGGHAVRNNKVLFSGMHQVATMAIAITGSGNDVVSHNVATYASRALMGGGLDDVTAPPNYWGYNSLSRGCQDSADNGDFYFTSGPPVSPLKTLEQMLVDTATWEGTSSLDPTLSAPAWGVYLDTSSSNWALRNIKISNIGSLLLINGGVNVTTANVTGQGAFDDSKMDYDNIGLRPDFPAEYGNGGITWTNDDSPACTYAGSGWIVNRHDAPVADDYGGNESYSNVAGDSFTCTFSGTEIRWAASTAGNRGTADVYVDGNLDKTVDLSTTTAVRQNVIYHKVGLVAGAHTLHVVVRNDRAAAGNVVVLDALGAK
jgi:hypothetical protein